MKKAVWLFIILAVLSSLAGCKTENAQGATVQREDAPRVVIMGEITQTVGNMITLNLMEQMEMSEAREMTEEEIAAARERFSEGGEGNRQRRDPNDEGNRPEGGTDNFTERFNMEEMTEEDRAALRERFSEGGAEGMPEGFEARGRNYTGESKEIVIPAGAPVLEVTIADGQRTESEIGLDKLKTGDVVEITYASDGETVAKVVKQAAAFGRVRTGGFGGGPGTEAEMFFLEDGTEGFMTTVTVPEGAGGGGISIITIDEVRQ